MLSKQIRHAFGLGAAAAVLALVAGAFSPSGPAFADEVDDAIAAMEQAAKDKDSGAAIAKMVELQDNLDKRVTKALIGLVKSRDDKIAANAIRQVAMRKDASLSKGLAKKLDDKKIRKDHIDVYHAYLDAAAMYGDPKHSKVLADIVKKFMDTDSGIATRAIKAFGAIREPSTVEQLIEWLGQAENNSGGGSGKNLSQDTRDNRGRAKGQIVSTLESLTTISIADSKSWSEFWDKRKKGFEFPDPNAPETDPATLTEWADIAYGYKIVKPAAEGWAFKKPATDGVRIWLDYSEKDEVIARIEIILHNLTSQSPKTLGELVSWYEGDFQDNRFKEIRGGLKSTEQSFGKRECNVIAAKGETSSSWGTAEVRAYLTKVEHIVVRVEGTVRLGAEPEVVETLWKTIETMPFDL